MPVDRSTRHRLTGRRRGRRRADRARSHLARRRGGGLSGPGGRHVHVDRTRQRARHRPVPVRCTQRGDPRPFRHPDPRLLLPGHDHRGRGGELAAAGSADGRVGVRGARAGRRRARRPGHGDRTGHPSARPVRPVPDRRRPDRPAGAVLHRWRGTWSPRRSPQGPGRSSSRACPSCGSICRTARPAATRARSPASAPATPRCSRSTRSASTRTWPGCWGGRCRLPGRRRAAGAGGRGSDLRGLRAGQPPGIGQLRPLRHDAVPGLRRPAALLGRRGDRPAAGVGAAGRGPDPPTDPDVRRCADLRSVQRQQRRLDGGRRAVRLPAGEGRPVRPDQQPVRDLDGIAERRPARAVLPGCGHGAADQRAEPGRAWRLGRPLVERAADRADRGRRHGDPGRDRFVAAVLRRDDEHVRDDHLGPARDRDAGRDPQLPTAASICSPGSGRRPAAPAVRPGRRLAGLAVARREDLRCAHGRAGRRREPACCPPRREPALRRGVGGGRLARLDLVRRLDHQPPVAGGAPDGSRSSWPGVRRANAVRELDRGRNLHRLAQPGWRARPGRPVGSLHRPGPAGGGRRRRPRADLRQVDDQRGVGLGSHPDRRDHHVRRGRRGAGRRGGRTRTLARRTAPRGCTPGAR